MPRFETDTIGVYVSSEEKLRGITKPFLLKNLVPFGAQANCLIPKENRGRKTPGQTKSFEGAVVGISEDCSAYRVWDFEARKIKEISFSFCVVSEGCFPWREKTKEEKEEGSPLTFFPTFEAFLTPEEWEKYKFSKEQQIEILKRKGLISIPPPPPSIPVRSDPQPPRSPPPPPPPPPQHSPATQPHVGVNERMQSDFLSQRRRNAVEFWRNAPGIAVSAPGSLPRADPAAPAPHLPVVVPPGPSHHQRVVPGPDFPQRVPPAPDFRQRVPPAPNFHQRVRQRVPPAPMTPQRDVIPPSGASAASTRAFDVLGEYSSTTQGDPHPKNYGGSQKESILGRFSQSHFY